MLICTHTRGSGRTGSRGGRGGGRMKRGGGGRGLAHENVGFMCVGGVHFQSKNTNDPNKAQAVLKPCSQLVHINI